MSQPCHWILGQKHQVRVIRFVIKDTVEEEIYIINKAEDKEKNINLKIFEITDDSLLFENMTEQESNDDTAQVIVKPKVKKNKQDDELNNL